MSKKLRLFTLVVAAVMMICSVAMAEFVYESRYGHNTLKRGHQNGYVLNLQVDINATTKGNCGTPDGIFGHNTEQGVMDYQRNTPGLDVDGQAGYNTKTALWYEEGQYK